MILANLSEEDKELYICFTYLFSRLEFLLKKARYLKLPTKNKPTRIMIDWDAFINEYSGEIKPNESGECLIKLLPENQLVQPDGQLIWTSTDVKNEQDEQNEFFKDVIGHVKAVRNNLFHGGKETLKGFEFDGRNKELIMAGKNFLEYLHNFLESNEKFQEKLTHRQ